MFSMNTDTGLELLKKKMCMKDVTSATEISPPRDMGRKSHVGATQHIHVEGTSFDVHKSAVDPT